MYRSYGERISNTPHCTTYCRIGQRGKEYHYHANAKRGRPHKGHWRSLRDKSLGRAFEPGDYAGVRQAARSPRAEREHGW